MTTAVRTTSETVETKPKRETQKEAREREKREAIDKLRELCPPGTAVYTILRHVSRSGMQRAISLRVIRYGEPIYLDGYVATALGDRIDERHQGIVVGGCGMDMGFELVYNLSAVLYPSGFGCIGPGKNGRGCPSNDHSNGDNDYTPHYDGTPRCTEEVGKDLKPHSHYHRSGGYALRHEWL